MLSEVEFSVCNGSDLQTRLAGGARAQPHNSVKARRSHIWKSRSLKTTSLGIR